MLERTVHNGLDLVVKYRFHLRAVLADSGRYPTSRIYFRMPWGGALTQPPTLGNIYTQVTV